MSLGSDITISSQIRKYARQYNNSGWEGVQSLLSLIAACSMIDDEKLRLGCAVYIFNLLQIPSD